MADWRNILEELLNIVVKKLPDLPTNIRFASVCRSWRLVGLEDRHRLTGPGFILPLSRSRGNRRNRQQHCYFIPLTDIIKHQKENKLEKKSNGGPGMYHLVIPCSFGEEAGSLCIEWFGGWMLVLDKNNSFKLLNPGTRSELTLPQDSSRHFSYKDKISMWATPTSHSVSDWYVFVALNLQNQALRWATNPKHAKTPLTYCRVGDGDWQVMESPECQLGNDKENFILDVLCSSQDGYLYVLMSTGELFCCDFPAEKKTRTRVAFGPWKFDAPEWQLQTKYLVEVEGQILLLHSRIGSFDLYRLDRVGKKWVETRELGVGVGAGKIAVFLGFGQPFSVAAEPDSGITGNCIYQLEEERCLNNWDMCLCCDFTVYDLSASTIGHFRADCQLEQPLIVGEPVGRRIPIGHNSSAMVKKQSSAPSRKPKPYPILHFGSF